MDSSYITPFIKSVQNVFETMLQLKVDIGEPALKRSGDPSYDVSGIIGMSGDLEGSIVLSFPTATAERVVSLFVGTDMAHSHADFPDAVGELVNMISGGAKAQFAGKHVSITCPSVVIGNDHAIHGAKDVICIHLPCQSDCGQFAVEVSIKQSCLKPAAATASAGAGAKKA
ncbi:MAG: chemotaxis protein CheX [Phycisphaeraceae bacterium]|nr:chemotaxis protein CheX [Phycisphaeraceae bacterium]